MVNIEMLLVLQQLEVKYLLFSLFAKIGMYSGYFYCKIFKYYDLEG